MRRGNKPPATLPPLPVGTPVLVFRPNLANMLWLTDPATGRLAEPDSLCPTEYVAGLVREVRDGSYRVTVYRDDREFYIDWIGRHRVRALGEPDPDWRH